MLQNDSKVKQGTQTGTEKTSSASRIIRRIETFSKKKWPDISQPITQRKNAWMD